MKIGTKSLVAVAVLLALVPILAPTPVFADGLLGLRVEVPFVKVNLGIGGGGGGECHRAQQYVVVREVYAQQQPQVYYQPAPQPQYQPQYQPAPQPQASAQPDPALAGGQVMVVRPSDVTELQTQQQSQQPAVALPSRVVSLYEYDEYYDGSNRYYHRDNAWFSLGFSASYNADVLVACAAPTVRCELVRCVDYGRATRIERCEPERNWQPQCQPQQYRLPSVQYQPPVYQQPTPVYRCAPQQQYQPQYQPCQPRYYQPTPVYGYCQPRFGVGVGVNVRIGGGGYGGGYHRR